MGRKWGPDCVSFENIYICVACVSRLLFVYFEKMGARFVYFENFRLFSQFFMIVLTFSSHQTNEAIIEMGWDGMELGARFSVFETKFCFFLEF